jgi:hypothetical protein
MNVFPYCAGLHYARIRRLVCARSGSGQAEQSRVRSRRQFDGALEARLDHVDSTAVIAGLDPAILIVRHGRAL